MGSIGLSLAAVRTLIIGDLPTQIAELKKEQESLSSRLDRHTELPMHPGTNEQISSLNLRLEEVETQFTYTDRHIRSLWFRSYGEELPPLTWKPIP